MGKASSDFKELTDAAGEEGATSVLHCAGFPQQALMSEQPW